jgi:archaeosine-15-forming tRNA-guanine transglycosylase
VFDLDQFHDPAPTCRVLVADDIHLTKKARFGYQILAHIVVRHDERIMKNPHFLVFFMN